MFVYTIVAKNVWVLNAIATFNLILVLKISFFWKPVSKNGFKLTFIFLSAQSIISKIGELSILLKESHYPINIALATTRYTYPVIQFY